MSNNDPTGVILQRNYQSLNSTLSDENFRKQYYVLINDLTRLIKEIFNKDDTYSLSVKDVSYGNNSTSCHCFELNDSSFFCLDRGDAMGASEPAATSLICSNPRFYVNAGLIGKSSATASLSYDPRWTKGGGNNLRRYIVIFSNNGGGIISCPESDSSILTPFNKSISFLQQYIFFTKVKHKSSGKEFPAIVYDSYPLDPQVAKYNSSKGASTTVNGSGGIIALFKNDEEQDIMNSLIPFPFHYSSDSIPNTPGAQTITSNTRISLQKNSVPVITNIIIPQLSEYYFPYLYKKQSSPYFFYGLQKINGKQYFFGNSFGLCLEE